MRKEEGDRTTGRESGWVNARKYLAVQLQQNLEVRACWRRLLLGRRRLLIAKRGDISALNRLLL
jgi:hypothetical protein